MENSFFEYRNETADKLSSDCEDIIDNSGMIDESFTLMKKPPPSAQKNRTVFVPESEDSESGDATESYDEEDVQNTSKSVTRRSGVALTHMISSSEEDVSKRGSIMKQSENSSSKVVLSSSDEEEVSPEIVPRRRPPLRQRNSVNSKSSDSPIIRRVKRRMVLNDSETDNSIIIDNDKTKMICLKDTPAKIDNGVEFAENIEPKNMSFNDSNVVDSNDDESVDDEEFGPDEDEMVMCKATRMSIMGIRPKDAESDDSDFIVSDESHLKSRSSNSVTGSVSSLNDLPDAGVSVYKPSQNTTEPPDELNNDELDDSKLSCSTFGSPVKDDDITKHITNENNIGKNTTKEIDIAKRTTNGNNITRRITNTRSVNDSIDLTNTRSVLKAVNDSIDLTIDHDYSALKRDSMILKPLDSNRFEAEDDEVTIIDIKPEVIALSSDEDETVPVKKSPNTRKSNIKTSKSPKIEPSTSRPATMKQYLLPESYPNQGMVFVKQHVRENELNKLNQLQEDLHNIRYLIENMDVDTLPDGGVKLLQRLSGLETEVKRQGDKVANMVVEPTQPTAKDVANDGFETGLTWDDIRQASNQVQPRMLGKQAMSTHMAERDLILKRLRNLHESLDSRPPEEEHAAPPKAMKSELMGHQLHALSWLRWRETQHPCGGILADDMGLGKTATMIALILSSKENNLDEEDDDDDVWTGKENSQLVRGGTLVVCPASLIQQWSNEVTKHCRSHALSVCLHHGATRATQPRRLATYELVVTTYNLLQRDSEKNGVLTRIRWTRIILDEAHIIRNHKAATSTAVSELKGQRRWCLTGTPVQNKDLDVFALLKFLRCTPFDDLAMWKKWIDNKSLGGQERLSTIMRCLLLRRTKQQLQERGQLNCLPERSLHQLTVTLTKEEMNVYQKVLVFSKTLFAQFLHQRAAKQDMLAGGAFLPKAPGKDDAYAKMHKKMVALQGAKPVKSHEILVLLLRLRQVCCHCGLIAAMLDDSEDAGDATEDPGSVDLLQELHKLSLEDDKRKGNIAEEEEEEARQEGTTVAEAIRSVLSPNNPVFDLKRQSSKIEAVMDCLRQNVFKNKGDKAVVVSQWTTVLHLVEVELNKSGVRSVTLSGKVPVTSRPPLIAALNDPSSNVRVMLLSLCAGGVGLNLCGANHLLLLDPHWNPQLEEQAQDRIYRVGQTKPVHIYRYMCLDTVEASIRSLQQTKLQVADSVLTGARHTNASKLSIEDLKMLFNMGPLAPEPAE